MADATTIDQLILGHLPTVRTVARLMALRSGGDLSVDDLYQDGCIGLIEAARRFDAERGILFKTFAEHRIRGAILDAIRRLDPLTRNARGHDALMRKASGQLHQESGAQEYDSGACATLLGIELDEYYVWQQEAAQAPVSLDILSRDTPIGSLWQGDSRSDAEAYADRHDLDQAIAQLSPRLQFILRAYYGEEGLSMLEIGERLEIGESRISQLHTEAVEKLSRWLRRTYHGLQ